MRIAVPAKDGRLFTHFGKAPQMALVEVDTASRKISGMRMLCLPTGEHRRLPHHLIHEGVHVVITGGMGEHAKERLTAAGIEVVIGAPCEPLEQIINAWLAGTLTLDPDACKHSHEHGHDHPPGHGDRRGRGRGGGHGRGRPHPTAGSEA